MAAYNMPYPQLPPWQQSPTLPLSTAITNLTLGSAMRGMASFPLQVQNALAERANLINSNANRVASLKRTNAQILMQMMREHGRYLQPPIIMPQLPPQNQQPQPRQLPTRPFLNYMQQEYRRPFDPGRPINSTFTGMVPRTAPPNNAVVANQPGMNPSDIDQQMVARGLTGSSVMQSDLQDVMARKALQYARLAATRPISPVIPTPGGFGSGAYGGVPA